MFVGMSVLYISLSIYYFKLGIRALFFCHIKTETHCESFLRKKKNVLFGIVEK